MHTSFFSDFMKKQPWEPNTADSHPEKKVSVHTLCQAEQERKQMVHTVH